jgi:protein-glutamine gamma-glutamyltransferase
VSISASVTDPSHGTRRSTAWAVCISIVAFAVADGAPLLGIGALFAAIMLHRVGQHPRVSASPRWALNGLLLFVAGFTVWQWTGNNLGVSSFARFLIGIMLVKLLDRRIARDEGQLLTLTAFLALATALTSVGLLAGLMLLIYVPVLIDATIRVQVMVARETASDRQPGLGHRVPFKRLGLAAALGIVALSLIVFVMIPRQLFDGRFGDMRGGMPAGQTSGFADQIRLGSRGIISQSPEPVMDVRFEDGFGNLLGGFGQPQYLRGAVLDTYDSQGRWTTSIVADKGNRVDMTPGMPTSVGTPPMTDVAKVVQHVVLRKSDQINQILFGVWRPYEVQLGEQGTVRLMGAGVMRASVSGSKLNYTLSSSRIDNRRRDRFRPEVPPLDLPRINQFAWEAVRAQELEPDPSIRPVEDDARVARALEQAIRLSAVYTLDQPPIPAGEDPTEWFLFEAKRGHCEYFASALAAACRAVGIDSRVIAGYVAMEFNEAGGIYLVRESNAHAWVEVSLGGGLWLTLDPTPPADLQAIHTPSPTMWSRLRGMMQAAEYAWVTRVIDFGGSKAWSGPDTSSGRRDSSSTTSQHLSTSQWALGIITLVIVAGAALIVQRITRRRNASTLPAELAGPWRQIERSLRRAGLARPHWRSMLDHAEYIARQSNEAAAELTSMGTVMNRVRYGGDTLDPQTITAVRTSLVRFQSALQTSRTRPTARLRTSGDSATD